MRCRGAGAEVPGQGARGDGVTGQGATGFVKNTGSQGLLGFAKNSKKKNNYNTKRFSLCRLYKLRTEQKIQTAEVRVKRMQGVE